MRPHKLWALLSFTAVILPLAACGGTPSTSSSSSSEGASSVSGSPIDNTQVGDNSIDDNYRAYYQIMVDTGSISGVTDTCVAVVDGTWDYTAAQKLFGDKLGCAKLPSYTVGGKDYQMGSFCGNKLLGVKPQSDSVKAALLNRIAAYLTGETGQAERFASLQWGPSNKAVQGSDAVKAAPQLVALAAQNAYGKPQGQFPGGWWTLAGGIGTSIQAAGKDVTDAALQTILDTYETAVQDLVKAA